MHTVTKYAALLTSLLILTQCQSRPVDEPPAFRLSAFETLPGWAVDDHQGALAAFLVSCEKPTALFKDVCVRARAVPTGDTMAARAFFEKNFTPYQVVGQTSGTKHGLLTGYFEPELRGSKNKGGVYQTPLYAMPPATNAPLPTRAQITAGALPDSLALVWVDDPVDAFFLEIQGSGRVRLEDGSMMRVGYVGKNGHPYTAIGRELVRRDLMTKEAVTMHTIRDWLKTHPDQASDMMHVNESYVFFRVLDVPPDQGPLGAQGVPLTPGRSLAIDHRHYPYGIPVWSVFADELTPSLAGHRLMIAQDTGGAIKGAVRGDYFWGAGSFAALEAGRHKARLETWVLYPVPHTPSPVIP